MLTLAGFEQRYPVLNGILGKMADWLHHRAVAHERLAQLKTFASEQDLARAARDLSLSRHELGMLMALSPGIVSLVGRRLAVPLARRLALIGVDRQRLRETNAPLMQDLATRCGGCSHHDRCESDLDAGRTDITWKSYCPNAKAIESLQVA